MEYTEYYDLKKPEETDPVLVGDLNDNADAIDTALNELNTGKQDTLSFDAAPTASSSNPVESGGIKTALDTKADNLQTVDGVTKTVNGWIEDLSSGGGGSSVTVKDGTDLVIAEASAGYTLTNVDVGTTVHIKESGNFVDYILVEKDTENAQAVVLRVACKKKDSVTSNWTSGSYFNEKADNWCQNTFINEFSDYVKSYMEARSISAHYNNGGLDTGSRKIYLPSATEIGSIDYSEGSNWFSTNTQRASNPAANYWTRSAKDTSSGTKRFDTWNSSNNTADYGNGTQDNYYWYRPAICFSIDTPVDETTKNIDGAITYTNTIDKLQDGNDYYKFADQEARAELAEKLPSVSSLADGNYKLRVSIASGVPTFSWEAET